MTTTKSVPTIGQLNGWWAHLLKVTLVMFPVFMTAVLSWGTWATTEIMSSKYFREYGPRFTRQQGDAMEARLGNRIGDIESRFNTLPPADWRNRILSLEADQKKIIEQNARILAEFEYLKRQLQDP